MVSPEPGLSLPRVSNELNESLRQFQMSLLRIRGDWTFLITLSREIAALMLEATGQSLFPVDLQKICQLRSIRIDESDDHGPNFEGRLSPVSGGFEVELSKSAELARKRTTVAHEIGHTLFYDTTRSPPVRAYVSRPAAKNADKEEWLCYDFGRSLLLPSSWVYSYLASHDSTTIERLLEFRDKAQVSFEVFARRVLSDLGLFPRMALFKARYSENKSDSMTMVFKGSDFPKMALVGERGIVNTRLWPFIQAVSEGKLDRWQRKRISVGRTAFLVSLTTRSEATPRFVYGSIIHQPRQRSNPARKSAGLH